MIFLFKFSCHLLVLWTNEGHLFLHPGGMLACCVIVDLKAFYFLHFKFMDGLVLHTPLHCPYVAVGTYILTQYVSVRCTWKDEHF